ncbi:MAG: glutamate mutase L [Anaerolineales bacterium]|nr:glutamate mutase L [Anaerolineales bacterium]
MTEAKPFFEEFDEIEALGDTQENVLAEELTAPEYRSGSLLNLDIGAVHTRASLFDIVEGRARFLAAGRAFTSAGSPLFDASEGMRFAIERVEQISGRLLIAEDGRPVIPTNQQGHGVDFMASTLSIDPPLKTVVVGLLDQVSLASVTHLAKTSYTEVVASIGLNNAQKPEEYIGIIQNTRPDLILIAGGTDKGATQSVLRLVNMIGMALYLLPEESRPEVIYAGNSALAKQVERFIKPLTTISLAPNIRPALTTERLGPAQSLLMDTFRNVHINRVAGLGEINSWCGNNLMPTAHAFGRVVRFVSKIVPGANRSGVLGIDLGASSVTVAASFDGDLRLRVFSNLGMGEGLTGILEHSQMEDVIRWIPGEVSKSYILDYIQNKIIHPGTLPVTPRDLYLEQALGREVLSRAIQEALPSFPKDAHRVEQNTLPTFDPIVVSGGVLTNAPSPAHSLLMVLDALQPTGIQRVLLDTNHLMPGLGAAAAVVPGLVSQLILDPTVLLNLGFVISPLARAREGTAILRIRVQYQSGYESTVNVHQGNVQLIPIPTGQRARVFIDPLHRANIGFGPGKGTSIQVVGGLFGLVVDARGRPLKIPDDATKRRNLLLKWQSAFKRPS